MGEVVKGDGPTDLELLEEAVTTLGVQATARLWLFCGYWWVTGRGSFYQVAEHEEALGPSKSARYRAYRDLRTLRERVAKRWGLEVDLRRLAGQVARGKQAGWELGATTG